MTTEAERDGLAERLRRRKERFLSNPGNYQHYYGADAILDGHAADRVEANAARIAHLEVEIVHWKKQAEAAASNAALFQQDCAWHVADKARKDEALKPFAFERSALDLSRYDDENQIEVRYPPVGRHQRIPVGHVAVGDIRRARAAISKATA